jgi:hypothetical protein
VAIQFRDGLVFPGVVRCPLKTLNVWLELFTILLIYEIAYLRQL